MFNIPVENKPKPVSIHPWAKTIKDYYADKIKRAHNSIRNVNYPKPKEKKAYPNRVTFTVVGNRMTREFIYCVNMVQGMHKYRWKKYDTPIIRGCTGVEWDDIWRNLKLEYDTAHCLKGQVAVFCDKKIIGGEKELKDMIESKYVYHLVLNYQKESINHFANYLKSSGRPCAYMHISIDGKPIGSLIFMLYSDVVPATCENFLRLCKARRGGYSGTPIHRVVKGGWIQGGGFGLKNTKMDSENFIVPHNKRGVLGMANAGRHIDCSTQFYVLLEPNEWFKFKYVAFGQLIDGEETLKKIEEVETYYEAPAANITISMAGVLNLDCQDIRINKGALEYLDGHVEDLVTIGELFYEMLMEHLFLEIEFRSLSKYRDEGSENLSGSFRDAVEEDQFVAPFNQRKEAIEQQFDVMRADTTGKFRFQNATSSVKNTDDENNDFDVDSYEYIHEEYKYTQATPSSSHPKEKKPYFIPFTDVPYPGEVDSSFDIKKMLKGDYCLESDLDPKQSKIERVKGGFEETINAISGIISSYGGMRSEESFSSGSLSSDEEQDIIEYLNLYEEKVSFSGKRVRRIAKNYMKANPIEETGKKESFTDDDVRMMRMALKDFKSRFHKKVSINVQPWSTSTKIKRRQTGFVKPEDMPDIDLDEDEDKPHKDESKKARNVSIVPGAISASTQKIHRRPTGYIGVKELNKQFRHEDDEDDDDDDNDVINMSTRKVSIDTKLSPDADRHHPIPRKQTTYYSHEDFQQKAEETQKKSASKKSSVRIAVAPTHSTSVPKMTMASRSIVDTNRLSMMRQSVLIRLLDDVADDDDDDTLPTLKEYKPHDTSKKQIKLAMSDTDINENTLIRKSKRVLRRASEVESSEDLKRVESAHVYNKSVLMMDHIGHEILPALRGATRSKLRPTMTITQYQKMNEERREEEKKLQALESKKSKLPV